MGTKTIIFKYDDMGDGEDEAVATVYLSSTDGVLMEIDLSAANLLEYNGAVARFAEHARPAELGTRRRGGGSTRVRSPESREQNAKIRSWARKQGLDVSERGRIAREVVDKYYAAARRHPGPI